MTNIYFGGLSFLELTYFFVFPFILFNLLIQTFVCVTIFHLKNKFLYHEFWITYLKKIVNILYNITLVKCISYTNLMIKINVDHCHITTPSLVIFH